MIDRDEIVADLVVTVFRLNGSLIEAGIGWSATSD